MNVGDVVQFNENHKWCGCLGIIEEIKPSKVMVGVPMPQQGTAYIFVLQDEDALEYIGPAVLVSDKENTE